MAVCKSLPMRAARRKFCTAMLVRDICFDTPTASFGYSHTRVRFGLWTDPSVGRTLRVAVKEVSLSRAEREQFSRDAASRIRNEAEVLRQAGSHRSILRFFGSEEWQSSPTDGRVLSLITEECNGGTLDDQTCGDWRRTLSDIADGMAHLHSRGICHRDLKPSNVFLVSGKGMPSVRIGDFDRAVRVDHDSLLAEPTGTLLYTAPEVLRASLHAAEGSSFAFQGPPADVYSFAMIAFGLVERRTPFSEISFAAGLPGSRSVADFNNAVVFQDMRPLFDPCLTIKEGPGVLARVRSLIRECWAPCPVSRPSFAAIHGILSELDDGGSGAAIFSVPPSKALQPADRGIAFFSAQGQRLAMEDAGVAFRTASPARAVVAVFDGHGGSEVATFAQRWLEARATRDEWWASLCPQAVSPASVCGLSDTADPNEANAAYHALSALEVAAGEEFRHRHGVDASGSTATLLIVEDSRISVAWLGDSQAVLCRQGDCGTDGVESGVVTAHAISSEHKPDSPDERLRIAAAGGLVRRNTRTMDDGNDYPYGPSRVFCANGSGGLAVTRALGDLHLRPVVSGEAEASLLRRLPGDLFIIVATDGLWDVFSHHDACLFVVEQHSALRRSQSEADAATLSRLLVDEALTRGSQDNVTVAVILLHAPDLELK